MNSRVFVVVVVVIIGDLHITMPKLVLLEAGTSRSARCRFTLLESGLAFEAITLKPRSEEARAANPSGKLPVLMVDDRPLYESAAICTFVADTAGEAAGLIPAPGSFERAEHDQWVSWTLSELDTWSWSLFVYENIAPASGGAGVADALGPGNKEMWKRSAAQLAAHLEEREWIVGDRFSVTDIICGWSLNWGRCLGWLENPVLEAYLLRLFARPACCFSREGLPSPPKM